MPQSRRIQDFTSESITVRPAPKNDDEAFIEAVASLFIPMGMLPIAARMNGYLLLRKDPMTLDELVEALGVSKSSASVAARVLERYGIARRFTERGTKRVRYGASDWCDGYLAQQVTVPGFDGPSATKSRRHLPQRPRIRPAKGTERALHPLSGRDQSGL